MDSRPLTVNRRSSATEHQFSPAENQPNGNTGNPINFGWGDKIAPRIGAAWDVFRDGRMKVFGSYGQFYDQMKLNVAISSFEGSTGRSAGTLWMTPNIGTINPAFNSGGRYCVGPNASSGANFAGAALARIDFPGRTRTCARSTPRAQSVAPRKKASPWPEAVRATRTNPCVRCGLPPAKNLASKRVGIAAVSIMCSKRSALFNPNVGEIPS